MDRLSDLPDSILVDILSLLRDGKQVVRSSVLSARWRFLWKSVPVSLDFDLSGSPFQYHSIDSEKNVLDFMASSNRELHYWRYFEKIRKFRVGVDWYKKRYVKDIDLWVDFATKLANVEHFTLEFYLVHDDTYEFPQFGFKNTSLRNLVLYNIKLNPCGSVNWTSLVSLSFECIELTEGVMEKVLSGCPNLECLKLDRVWGIHHLEISSVKMRVLTICDYCDDHDLWLEISCPYIQNLELWRACTDLHLLSRNVFSLVSAVLHLDRLDFDALEKQCSNMKELLHNVAHAENLELSSWCIECLSILELKEWQPPLSSRKFLKLNAALEQLDFPGICSFLQSSSDLETLVINWFHHKSRDWLLSYTNEDEQIRRFETHNFDCSLLHLKTIKIINFDGPLYGNKSVLPFVKHLLKIATVLEKFIIAAKFEGSDASLDYVRMAQELLSFPRSSPHASVIFSY